MRASNGWARRGVCDACEIHGLDFAAEGAERGHMRLTLLSSALACAALVAGAASAQDAPDGPVPTAGSKAGGAPTEAAPAQVVQTPPAARPQQQPLASDLMAASDAGRRAPLLGEYHGEVGAVVGTGGLRGAYGHINAHPNDNMTIDLRFSTLHAKGYPYGGAYGPGFYGPGAYGPGVYGGYGPGAYGPPLGSRPGPDGWTTETLEPDEAAPPAQSPSGH